MSNGADDASKVWKEVEYERLLHVNSVYKAQAIEYSNEIDRLRAVLEEIASNNVYTSRMARYCRDLATKTLLEDENE